MSEVLFRICRIAMNQKGRATTTALLPILACRNLQFPTFAASKRPICSTPWLTSSAELNTAAAPPSDDSAFSLRPYQEECIEDCLSAIKSGVTRIGVSSPTGSGKTTIFTHLIDRIPPRANGGDRVLIMVNSIELAIQAADSIRAAFPHKSVEIEQGSKYKATGFADVTVATYQTLNRSRERLQKLDPDYYKAVVVDEAHHAAAPSYLKVLSYFDPELGREEGETDTYPTQSGSFRDVVPIVGFSATFSRHDGLALGKVFDRIVFHKDFLQMIGEKWLCPIRFTSIKADLDLASVKLSNFQADFATSSLASVVNTPIVNRIILKAWIDKAHKRRRSTLIFAVNIEHVQDLTETFRQAGVDARYLHGGTPISERRQLLHDFRAGLYPILVNCAILTEGADVPSIDCVLLARPTRSRNLFSQMIGRGLRLSPKTGKKDCLVLDIVGNVEQGVICTPTLFGLSVDEIIDGETSESLLDRKQESATFDASAETDAGEGGLGAQLADPSRLVYVDYDDPFQLQKAMSARSSVVETMSPNAWVDCGAQHYILEIPRYGFVQVQRTDDDAKSPSAELSKVQAAKWTSWFTPSNIDVDEAMAAQGKSPISPAFARSQKRGRGHTPYRRPRHVLFAPDMEAAIRGSDIYAKKTILRNSMQLYGLLNRRANWRQARASDSQRSLIEKRLGISGASLPADTSFDEEASTGSNAKRRTSKGVNMSVLTKGQAGVLLTRLKHGAKARWQQQVKAANKSLRLQEREQKRVDRETVRVGPLASH